MAVITSSVDKITFVEAKITFTVAVITSLVAKITFIVAEITFKEVVITSSVVKITFVVAEITLVYLWYIFSIWVFRFLSIYTLFFK